MGAARPVGVTRVVVEREARAGGGGEQHDVLAPLLEGRELLRVGGTLTTARLALALRSAA